jgi:hypothetical protein
MASEIYREQVIGNFKPKRAERLKAKKSPADKRKKLPGNSEKHLQAIRLLPCCIPGCQVVGCDPHHLKSGPASAERGAALKARDRWTVPLCRHHHEEVERRASKCELFWFLTFGVEPLELAAALWMVSPDRASMCRIILAHKQQNKSDET